MKRDAEEKIPLAAVKRPYTAHVPIGELCIVLSQHCQRIKTKVNGDWAVSAAQFALIERANSLVPVLGRRLRSKVETNVFQVTGSSLLNNLWTGIVHLHQPFPLGFGPTI
jgi:hypothetical protein